MNNEKLLQEVSKQVKIRGFSKETHKSYIYNLTNYMKYFGKDVKLAQKTHIENYILHLINRKLSENTIRQILASLHFAFSTVLNKDIVSTKKIPRIKKRVQLPKVLTKNEITKLLENLKNLKYKLMIEIIYSSGLRVSELINLKREDINSENNTIHIQFAKDKKDRITILSKKVKEKLTKYLLENKFKTKYLFENKFNKKYTERSIEEIFKKSSEILKKKVNPQMLRHSFATHLLESGIDILYIQKLLGHSNIRTTSKYINVAKISIENIKSPFD